ncbi:MAG TPA: MBL fold metallo-hydrolase [Bacteroidia bacterium]|nr:MBL fold metallo-hydrolase [Bacteroidia bacterium]QQR94092.1 MAG: MBL fold metallo-hydrolase [Bacteroidota bacterium]MBP7713197.1 MBL fold metallo-hydrolase [Bacteroidia bacterium]MBP8667254.1 MBL fold metallo-hydrolase [Bacteroidia bacterium]HOZ83401.1 MBL fold metallo-hydrolase [Bacteroidia bacterium]
MKITFLGTGTSQGVPVIACNCNVCQSTDLRDKRLRTSIHIQHKNSSFVIDSGPDFRQQMLRAQIKNLTALIFTHEHKDHVAGMDDIRAFNYVLQKKIDIYATLRVQEALVREFPYVFHDFKYPGVPEVNMITIDEHPFNIEGLEFIPIEVLHYKLPVNAYRVGDFTYITDANFISEKEKEKIKGSRIVVINALRREKHVSHFNLEEALELIKELKPEKAYLTHISHQLGKHSDVEKELPPNVFLAYDGFEIEMS